ncbi:hypothetical protein JCM11491_002490 [Sporobolomyces phaffii]
MLSSLPPELLRLIIESSVPCTFRSTTYRTRQRTLRSLCLVSRRFRAIAQPLLLEIVWITTPAQLNSLSSLHPQRSGVYDGSLTHLAVVGSQPIVWSMLVPSTRLFLATSSRDALTSVFSSVTTLRLNEDSLPDLNASYLNLLPNLTHLSLCDVGGDLGGPVLLLQHLHSLTLSYVSPEGAKAIMVPSALPSLRAISLRGHLDPEQSSRLAELVPLLDVLVVDLWIWKFSTSSDQNDIAERTMLDVTADELGLEPGRQYRHLRIIDSYPAAFANFPGAFAGHLERFVHSLESGRSPSLLSIYLDKGLAPGQPLSSSLRRVVDRLAQICHVRKVDLVFEPLPRDWVAASLISPEFWKRQKERRRREQATQ